MALSSFVYISDVDNLSDARYTAGMGVDLIGFRLNPKNESSLRPERFKEISAWVSGVKLVGEFGDSTPEEVKEALTHYNVDYLLVSDESQIHEFTQFDKPLILRISINEETKDTLASTFNYCSGAIDYFLLESGLTKLDKEEISFINSYSSQFPILLGYGVNKENAKTIVGKLKLKGISLKGSSEIRPGYKDFDEMADILEVLEID
jgi:phosphoribosylanthranilate isomerase